MATTASGTEFSGDVPAALQAEGEKLPPGLGPWTLAWRRLRRNHVALFFGGLFILIVVLCLLAPVYAKHVAHQGPSFENITGTVKVHGKNVDIVSPTGIPVGPDVAQQVLPRRPTPTAATSRSGCSTAGATRSRSGSWRR